MEGWGWCGTATAYGRIVASTIGQTGPATALQALSTTSCNLRDKYDKLAKEWLSILRLTLDGSHLNRPKMKLIGTEFQQKIWLACVNIPLGQTRTYSWVAHSAGFAKRKYSRPAAAALSANPLLVFVPCHRVILADGKLGGYSAGVHLKQKLLSTERMHAANPSTDQPMAAR